VRALAFEGDDHADMIAWKSCYRNPAAEERGRPEDAEYLRFPGCQRGEAFLRVITDARHISDAPGARQPQTTGLLVYFISASLWRSTTCHQPCGGGRSSPP
jgi:hypothetical protein